MRSASPPRGPDAVRRAGVLVRLLVVGLLGAATALLVSCSGSGRGLIPSAQAGPLKNDFSLVEEAAKAGRGSCAATEAALQKTASDFAALPASVDAGLRRRLREGLNKLREDALELCAQALTQSTTTAPRTTTTTQTTATTPTTPPNTTTTQTTPSTTTTTPNPSGGTPPAEPEESESSHGPGNGNGHAREPGGAAPRGEG